MRGGASGFEQVEGVERGVAIEKEEDAGAGGRPGQLGGRHHGRGLEPEEGAALPKVIQAHLVGELMGEGEGP